MSIDPVQGMMVGPALLHEYFRSLTNRLYQAQSEAVTVTMTELDEWTDHGINRPVLVSTNLAGSDPDWKFL